MPRKIRHLSRLNLPRGSTLSTFMSSLAESWDIILNAVSTAIQYASLDFPPRSGWLQYNGLQMIAYFTTVFVAAPLAIVTGLLMSTAVAARFKTAKGLLNGQMARKKHRHGNSIDCLHIRLYGLILLEPKNLNRAWHWTRQ